MDGSVRSGRRARVRLTRRGRIVMVAAAFFLAGVLVLLAAPAVTAAAIPDPAGAAPAPAESSGVVAVVLPGDTLWSVAARHLPSHDAPGVVAEIRRLNDLSGTTIHPGQRLRLPAR
ncbi:LysM peptidoglycan-binding domain-containing protein [Natronosporangium hydrolyticum]|uniref:LysM peptidoglycan-binding domain-containing protein n=1 Tax=Natronosporangium hydrolyticum TaxID=2811111 RepID=A0A895YDF9_9ACTN|nr:LysM peptidoglycan-binding domain-containing protein [Natronosporangium hydrolyticum]QSB13419.1 LysM peptidoglycan-binding domain-containing protein [Natronosporangium hydrolyticum]